MSYILEALKKAESERRLGSVPTVHAQPLQSFAFEEELAAQKKKKIWIAGASSTAVAIGIFAAIELWKTEVAPTEAVPPAVHANISSQSPEKPLTAPIPTVQVAANAQPSPSASAPATPSDRNVESSAPVRKVTARQTTAANDEPQASPTPKKKENKEAGKPVSKEPAKASAPQSVKKDPAAADGKGRPDSAALLASANNKPGLLHDLPQQIQSEMPKVEIGGYIYSPIPSERSMLLNNKLVREGEQVAPGLTLETMLPKEAVLSYKGYRYRLPF